jgi:hypothetical protein
LTLADSSSHKNKPFQFGSNPFLAQGAEKFLFEQKVLGSVKNVAKKPKEELIKAYEKMFEEGAFKVHFSQNNIFSQKMTGLGSRR